MAPHHNTYRDNEVLTYIDHSTLTTDADGNVTDEKTSHGKYELTLDRTFDGQQQTPDPLIIPLGSELRSED